jgi:hypothetical protein
LRGDDFEKREALSVPCLVDTRTCCELVDTRDS